MRKGIEEGAYGSRGGGNNVMEDVKVPYILALPGVLVDYIHTMKGGQCRPHELLIEAGRRIAGEYGLPADDWSLVKKWCMVAAQAKADGDSHVALKLQPANSADKSFLDWCERRIDTTMGLRVREIGGQGSGQQGGQAHLLATTATAMKNIGNQMVAGLQLAMNASAQQGGGGWRREHGEWVGGLWEEVFTLPHRSAEGFL